jgi:hypothetical protein
VDRFQLAWDRVQRRALVDTIMSLRITESPSVQTDKRTCVTKHATRPLCDPVLSLHFLQLPTISSTPNSGRQAVMTVLASFLSQF